MQNIQKLPPFTTYFIELGIISVLITRLVIGPEISLSGYTINLSLLALYLVVTRLCIVLFVREEVPSIFGKTISAQNEKEKSFDMGIGLLIITSVIIYI